MEVFIMRSALILCLVAFALSLFALPHASAAVTLPAIVGDNMVLQQGKWLRIWGWASPDEKVTVTFAGQKASTTAHKAGNWSVRFQPLKAGGPFDMTIAGDNTIVLHNVLIGEVWVASGQSNMEWGMWGVVDKGKEIAAADWPKIRLFTVTKDNAPVQRIDCKGSWAECSPKTVGGFSAVAYYFGRELHKQLGIPIGLINTSWGGTAAEAWTSRNTIESDPDLAPCLTYNSMPTGLYNGMIAPIKNFAIAGAIWYQGESNAGRAYQYRKLLPAMINCWRRAWAQGDFPFYIVELANFMAVQTDPNEGSGWAELREAQTMTTTALPNVGIACIIDIGEAGDIHPKNKLDVGNRLALIALARDYGRKIEFSGPMYAGMKVEGAAIRISFTHLDGGLVVRGGALKGFVVAGADKKFVWASARVEGSTVVVSADGITEPVAVRYDWANNPQGNLYNMAGLPTNPFRTDDWQGVTFGAR
jgi:sialate O-acetylesterase